MGWAEQNMRLCNFFGPDFNALYSCASVLLCTVSKVKL